MPKPGYHLCTINVTHRQYSDWKALAKSRRATVTSLIIGQMGLLTGAAGASPPPAPSPAHNISLGTGAIGDMAGVVTLGLADALRAVALDAASGIERDDVPFAAVDVLTPVVPPAPAVALRSGVLSADERRALRPTIRITPILAGPVKLVASLMPGPAPTSFPRTIGGSGGSFDRLKRTFGQK